MSKNENIMQANTVNEREITPIKFIDAAYSDVQSLTDDGDQMHRRAVAGKPLYVHLHGWDRWANEAPARGGVSEVRGGRSVTLRVQGQYMDRGVRYTSQTTAEAIAFATEVDKLLASMPVPVPLPENC